jgi:hypothetical protein
MGSIDWGGGESYCVVVLLLTGGVVDVLVMSNDGWRTESFKTRRLRSGKTC